MSKNTKSQRLQIFSRELLYAEKIGNCAEENCIDNICPIAGKRYFCQDCSLHKEKTQKDN